MATEIEHQGIVTACNNDVLTIEIQSKSACSGCHARGMCSASDAKTKHVEVQTTDAASYAVGESVSVVAAESMGLRAVVLAYVAPLVLMVAVLVAGNAMGAPDGKVGLLALALLVPYYAVLYVLRGRFKRDFVFRVKRM